MAFQWEMARAVGLSKDEVDYFRPLSSPEKVQDSITAIPVNFEPHGDTCHSVRTALRKNRAHCIEGAFVAACALMLHGRPALIMDFVADDDDDHVLTLFRHGRRWGAVSKSNSLWLRWRDPVYSSLREIAMSYFHEYGRGTRRTLRSYSRAFDLGDYDPRQWITNSDHCWDMAAALDECRHFRVLNRSQIIRLRPREKIELHADQVKQYKKNGTRRI
jgi:hypothetical protein